MSFPELARYEWILIELLVLGILVWQLISVRRAIRVDRAKARELDSAKISISRDTLGQPPP